MNYLNSKEYKCPKPIASNQDEYILNIKDKPCTIVSFIEGNWIKNIRNTHCQQLGHNLAKLHALTKDFSLSRKNSMGYNSWNQLFDNFKSEKVRKKNMKFHLIKQRKRNA